MLDAGQRKEVEILDNAKMGPSSIQPVRELV
jgi:hypothetical protein